MRPTAIAASLRNAIRRSSDRGILTFAQESERDMIPGKSGMSKSAYPPLLRGASADATARNARIAPRRGVDIARTFRQRPLEEGR